MRLEIVHCYCSGGAGVLSEVDICVLECVKLCLLSLLLSSLMSS